MGFKIEDTLAVREWVSKRKLELGSSLDRCTQLEGVRDFYTLFTRTRDTYYESVSSGNYFPLPSERMKIHHGPYNCTTIIPEIYILCEEKKINPEIKLMHNIIDKNNSFEMEPHEYMHHYCIRATINEKPYLIDPFMQIFGEIVKEKKGVWTISQDCSDAIIKRKFSKTQAISEDEFCKLIDYWRTPAGSLEMLSPGQVLYNNISALGDRKSVV